MLRLCSLLKPTRTTKKNNTDGYKEHFRKRVRRNWSKRTNPLYIRGLLHEVQFENGRMPILTTKKMAWKTCLRELLWFIHGSTDNTSTPRTFIYGIWTHPRILDKRGYPNTTTEILDPCTGFNGDIGEILRVQIQLRKRRDQLQNIIDLLKNPETRSSRRILMTAWNANELDNMTLYPCHVLCQFNVQDGTN
jgi:thymidylate synthase